MAELTENLIRLKSAGGVGNVTVWRLLDRFGDSDGVFGASERELCEVEGVSREKAQAVLAAANWDARPEMDKAAEAGVDILPYDDPAYPKPLLHTFDPPAVLYVRGRLAADDQIAVGIVGTRNASRYGRDQAGSLAGGLSRAGYTVVSGLARGIDTRAHTGALDAGGRTIGVLGCGFDHMYPEENRDLAWEISRSGAVVTEFPMATRPSRETFPVRNRIIAGMSLGVLVIEAPMRSGALITARQANDVGRPVFAVPGRVGDANSEGCNKLIAGGATMVMSVDDILQELNPALPPPPAAGAGRGKTGAGARERPCRERRKTGAAGPPRLPGFRGPDGAQAPVAADPGPGLREPRPRLTPDQAAAYAAVGAEWMNIDDIAEAVGLPAGRAAAALALLRILRLVEQGPGQTYRRKRNGA